VTHSNNPQGTRVITIISGGQNGVDQAALEAAKELGIPTGGYMPKGFITLDGPRPEFAALYGTTETPSSQYPPRTFANAHRAEATLRLAWDFNTLGERATLIAITRFKRPFMDVNLHEPPEPDAVVDFILKHAPTTLNVAGNSNRTHPTTQTVARQYLLKVFTRLTQRNQT